MRTVLVFLLAVTTGVIVGSCNGADDGHDNAHDDLPQCRFDPDCHGGIGGLCAHDDDCDSGFCCQDGGNCAGGMCTLPCDHDGDCPSEMRCEHSVCFFACDHDGDCADGMSCEHGNTICEWP